MDHIEWDDETEDETPTLVDHIAQLYDTLWKSWATCRGPFTSDLKDGVAHAVHK